MAILVQKDLIFLPILLMAKTNQLYIYREKNIHKNFFVQKLMSTELQVTIIVQNLLRVNINMINVKF